MEPGRSYRAVCVGVHMGGIRGLGRGHPGNAPRGRYLGKPGVNEHREGPWFRVRVCQEINVVVFFL